MNQGTKPAFPESHFFNHPTYGPQHIVYEPGLTKREYFAAIAMQGQISRLSNEEMFLAAGDAARMRNMRLDQFVAETAVQYADTLLAELQKE